MKISKVVEFFIHPDRFEDPDEMRRASLFVRACLLTSVFSNSYIFNSLLFEFDKGVVLMVFNGIGFLLLPFLARTKLSMNLLGNIYVLVGAVAIYILAYYSGGIWSPLYPWIIAIPVLALLVVNKVSGFVWGGISLIYMIYLGVLDLNGEVLPIEYNTDLKTELFLTVVPGLLLIILLISFVFEGAERRARQSLEMQFDELAEQKNTISYQSTELKELVEQKEYIIRILAHDLRNPLQNISGLVDLLKNDSEAEHQEEYIGMIDSASNRAQELISKVLEMDASDQEDVTVSSQRTIVKDVLEQVIQRSEEVALNKSITITTDFEDDKLAIDTDAEYLKLIFENLLSNAIKYSNKRATVRIDCLKINQRLLINFLDEGPGINITERDQLFMKFSKLSTRPTDGESSIGLGLSLVKRYVELIGGKVWYEDNVPKGSVFVVEIPT